LAKNYNYRTNSLYRSGSGNRSIEMDSKPFLAASAMAMGFCAFFAGATFSGAIGASAAYAAVQSQPASAQPDRSRRVCRNVTPTSSRLTQRVCRTQADWDRSQDRTQDGVLQHQMGDGTTIQQAPGPR
jgi:hypothetical protein